MQHSEEGAHGQQGGRSQRKYLYFPSTDRLEAYELSSDPYEEWELRRNTTRLGFVSNEGHGLVSKDGHGVVQLMRTWHSAVQALHPVATASNHECPVTAPFAMRRWVAQRTHCCPVPVVEQKEAMYEQWSIDRCSATVRPHWPPLVFCPP